jgi:ribonucleoside-diphosphate reductase alpha chain
VTDDFTQLEGIRKKVFMDRYALKDAKGKPTEEYPEQMWHRVAHGIASVEHTEEGQREWANKFYDILKDFQFVPGGRILTGAGTPHKVTYYNCFVIPSPEDSREGILDTLKTMTEIMARGGGVGINFSSLRPRGSHIKTVNGTASGPCSWIQLFSVATGEVIQQGGSRRGALMAMLDDNHPDIEEFITCKKTPGWITHANLSICVSDDFMDAVKNDKVWRLIWNGEVQKVIKARGLWDLICTAAWESAEPGLVFMERYNKQSNTWYYEKITTVNPCGEQGLGDWGVCNLGAVNLAAFADPFSIRRFDMGKLAYVTKTAMRFLDDVIDATDYFIDENKEAQLGTRRTGLGTMGLADTLIALQMTYGSDESLTFIDRVYSTIRDAAYEASIDLAKEKECFPRYDPDLYQQGKFIERLPKSLRSNLRGNGIRNAVLLTQAPTGTTSLLAGVSSGIEPVYDFAMIRRDRTGEHVMYHPLMQGWLDSNPGVKPPPYFVSSKDLSPEEHVRVQAKIQEYTDASISKTVNAPHDHTVEQVQKLYRLAYDLGCKGVTYYRDGSRDAVLTRIADEQKKEAPDSMKSRPQTVQGYTRQIIAPEGKVNITINSDEEGPLEVFINVGKAGSDIAALSEALGRLISLILQIPSTLSQEARVSQITDQLHGIGGSKFVGIGRQQVRSLPDAVAQVLGMQKELTPGVLTEESRERLIDSDIPFFAQTTGNLCPQCSGFSMVYEEGCKKCYSCGYSEC